MALCPSQARQQSPKAKLIRRAGADICAWVLFSRSTQGPTVSADGPDQNNV